MKTKYTKLIYTSLLVAILIAVACCARHGKAWNDIDRAESLMASRPDSALSVLESIAPSDLTGKEAEARYALLMSMALDKNYVDTTTFSILQPAIDYYLQHGTPDEKLRTLYYQGRIYQNQGDDEAALTHFLKATDLKNEISDSLSLARTYVAISTLQIEQYKTEEFTESNLAAAKIYKALNNDVLALKSYSNALDGMVMRNNRIGADSLVSVCMNLIKDNPDIASSFFSSYSLYIIEYGTTEETESLLSEYSVSDLSQDEAINFARGYVKIGNYEKAANVLSSVNLNRSILDSLRYSSVKTDILEKQGDFKQAFYELKDYLVMSENYQHKLMSQDLLFVEDKHQIEIESFRENQKRERIVWGLIVTAGLLLFVSGWLWFINRLNRSKRIIAEKENENLRLAQELLKKDKESAELRAANILHENELLEEERDKLSELLAGMRELSAPIHDVILLYTTLLRSVLKYSTACWQKRFLKMTAMQRRIINGLSQYAMTKKSL